MKRIVGIDIGGTKISVILGTPHGRILEKKVLKTRLRNEVKLGINEIFDAVNELLGKRKTKKNDLMGVGIGIPGPGSAAEGIVQNAPNLPGWAGINIKKLAEKRFHCPVYCNNDANAACLAEKIFGGGKKVRNFVYVTISTGVGSGIIIDNKLLMGANNNAGELGHIIVDVNGPLCNCGKRGCLEALSSGTAIANFAQDIMSRNRNAVANAHNEYVYKKYRSMNPKFHLSTKSTLMKLVHDNIDNIHAALIDQAAKNGDEMARYIYWRAGYYFGIGIANVIQLFNPEMISLGGSVIKAGKLYFDAMKLALKEYTWSAPLQKCHIVHSKLGSRVADFGCLSLVVYPSRYR